jgi:hypothetical protein
MTHAHSNDNIDLTGHVIDLVRHDRLHLDCGWSFNVSEKNWTHPQIVTQMLQRESEILLKQIEEQQRERSTLEAYLENPVAEAAEAVCICGHAERMHYDVGQRGKQGCGFRWKCACDQFKETHNP